MKQKLGTLSAVALLSALLPGCAGDSGRYPSLAMRDVERVNGQFDPASRVEPVELAIRAIVPSSSISELVDQANASHQRFVSKVSTARSLAVNARGTGRDSDARGRAIVALADLTSVRSQTEIALGDLDMLIAERTNRLEPADEAIAAHASVLQLVAEQDRTLTDLWSLLGQ